MIDPQKFPEFSRAQTTFIFSTFVLIALSTFVTAPTPLSKLLSGIGSLCGVVAVACVNYVFMRPKGQPEQGSVTDAATWGDQPSRVLPAATKIEVLIIGSFGAMLVLALLSLLIR